MGYEARYVFRPDPGADLGAVIEAMKRGAALWKQHGASQARLWSVASGELGNYVLALEFANAAEYAKVTDPLSADPAFHKWQADNLRKGGFSWVRSNLLREVVLT